MELLVIFLGEFLLFPVFALIGMLFNLLACAVFYFLDFVLILCRPRVVAGTVRYKKENAAIIKGSGVFRLFARISGALCLLVFFLLFVASTFLFSPIIGLVTAQVAQKMKANISFDSVEGNLLAGQVKFHGFHAKREYSEKVNLDISADSMVLDIDVLSLIGQPIVFELLEIDGVNGSVHYKRPVNKEAQEKEQKAKEVVEKLKPKKEFIIHEMALRNVSLDLEQDGKEPLVLLLDKIESKPLRSSYAIFDTFFRSNVEGSINGNRFTLLTEEIKDGRKTKWKFDNFPVNIIGQYIHKPPINWFKEGYISINVEDEWQYGEETMIAMDWRAVLRNAVAEIPDDASILSKTLSSPFVKYINSRDGNADFHFRFTMNEKQFESVSSLDMAGLWEATVDALLTEWAKRTGEKIEALKEKTQGGMEGLKNFLNRERE